MLTTSGVAPDRALASAAASRSTAALGPEKILLEIAETREQPPSPEPLGSDRFRTVVWLVPALVAAVMGLWWGDPAEVLTGPAAATAGLNTLWVESTSSGGWIARLSLSIGAAASAALLAAVGTQLSRRRTGILAGLLYAVLPGSASVALGALVFPVALSLVALLLVIRLAQRPSVLRSALYALSLVALGIVLPVALVAVLPHGLIVLRWGRPRGRRILAWSLAATGALAAVAAIGGLLGVFAGVRVAPAVVSISMVSDWATATFGVPVLAGAVLGVSFLGLAARDSAGAATGYAVGSTVALLAWAAAIAPGALDALPIIAPAWCLVAGIALSRVRMARAGCAVALIAVLGLPTQVLLRHPEPAASASLPGAIGLSEVSGRVAGVPVVLG